MYHENGSSPRRVLVAGDREELRPLLAALRQAENYLLIEAGSAGDALTFVRQRLADIAVLDLAHIGLEALEVLREIQKLPAPIPVIFFSDSRDLHFAVEVMKAGAADYLVKPVLPDDLREAIRKTVAVTHGPPVLTAGRQREAKARRSDRLETLLRLTTTLAHELNNQITVLLGYTRFVLETLSPSGRMYEELREVHRAGERAASLCRQLLDYGRKREQKAGVMDLNLLISGMVKMLERLLGETIDVEPQLAPEPALIRADPAQMEQAILNLALNARDAMAHGGRLTIRTRAVLSETALGGASGTQPPLARVQLSVSDTGCGMDENTQARIFEPFFTTKPAEQGTGLGLNIISKIVEQAGGNIGVASAPGSGTTFTIQLPQVTEGTAAPETEERGQRELVRGSETLLLVEDNEQVRQLLTQYLARQGYTVLGAQNYQQALDVCEQYDGVIDLMLTDIALPHMDGPELAERALMYRPEMKVLYMSGYADPFVARRGEDGTELPFIQKPFGPDALAFKLRELLDGSPKPKT